jgi:hypothetical protein
MDEDTAKGMTIPHTTAISERMRFDEIMSTIFLFPGFSASSVRLTSEETGTKLRRKIGWPMISHI